MIKKNNTCKICSKSCLLEYCEIHRTKEVQEVHKKLNKTNTINKGKNYAEYLEDIKDKKQFTWG